MERELIDMSPPRGGGGGRRNDVRRLINAIDPMRAMVNAMYGPPPRRGGGEARDDGGIVDRETVVLHSQRQALSYELSGWETKVAKTKDDISDITSKINALRDDEIKSQEATIESLKSKYDEEKRMANEYKRTFLLTHERTSNESNLGPGHAVLQRRELSKMDSLEDYERYVKDREDALWKKIDALVQKIQKDSRREAIEW
jgi:predicted RNase H-like nuclease (RuvC/YqgF family)